MNSAPRLRPAPSGWTPGSWRARPVRQLPEYPDAAALQRATHALRARPALVIASEVDALRARLADVAAGRAFVLQGGDCAESFDDAGTDVVRETFRVMLQMAVVLTYAASCPVVKIGRVAGQFAKPRSSDTETRDGHTLPSYRGDIINGSAFDAATRAPDPERLLTAYAQSAATLNLLRALSQGGFADLRAIHRWTTDFVRASPQGERFAQLAARIDQSLAFMRACGFDAERAPQMHAVEYYTSHEALHLPYEEALAHPLDAGGPAAAERHFAGSAHMLWLGERTRAPDEAHVEFLRGITNPVGIKLGPSATPEQALTLLERLDPERLPGRIVLISRMGAAQVRDRLPPLLRAVAGAGWTPVWCCDPMHGNTVTAANGYKTRDFARVLDEVRGFFDAHAQCGTWPGGVHVEMTGLDVTECRGGAQALDDEALARRYSTACDPRLNGSQSLELAFLVADMLQARRDAAG